MESVKKYGLDEVKLHSAMGDCWIIIKGKVYDVSAYMEKHPGGAGLLLDNSKGVDAFQEYEDADHTKRAREMLTTHYIGELDVWFIIITQIMNSFTLITIVKHVFSYVVKTARAMLRYYVCYFKESYFEYCIVQITDQLWKLRTAHELLTV